MLDGAFSPLAIVTAIIIIITPALILLAAIVNYCDLTLFFSTNYEDTAFNNKIVWITGASSGIGLAVARRILRKGPKGIILSSRNERELISVKKQLGDDDRICILPLDLGENFDADAVCKRARSAFSNADIDILINCAGIYAMSTVTDSPLQLYQKLMQVNFFGSVSLTKAVIPSMMTRKQGKIVFVSSFAGIIGSTFNSCYTSTKAALVGFSDCLRSEMQPYNVHVLTVYPGSIHTPLGHNTLLKDGDNTLGIDTRNHSFLYSSNSAVQWLVLQ